MKLTYVPCESTNRLSLRNGFDSFFDEALAPFTRTDTKPDTWAPPVDIHETEIALTIHADLPGMKKEDIGIEVHENVLTLSGTRNKKVESDDDGFVRKEVHCGAFTRSFRLPDTVDSSKVLAKYTNGVLAIKIKKTAKAKPRAVQIH